MSLAVLLREIEGDAEEPRRNAAAGLPAGALSQLLAETSSDGSGEGRERRAGQPPGYFGGLAGSARRGLAQAEQAVDAVSLVAGAGLMEDAGRDPARIATERQADPEPDPAHWQPGGSGIGGQRGYLVAVEKWRERERQREERLANSARFGDEMRAGPVPGLVGSISKRQQEIEAAPRSEIMRAWDEAEAPNEWLGVLVAHPIEVLSNLVVSGLTSGAPTLIGGAVGSVAGPVGQAAGAGLGSLATEAGGKIVEEMRAAGADFSRPETVAAILADEDKIDAIRKKALARGVPVAALDAVSAGIAGKLVTSPAKSLLRKVGQGAAEMGVQAGLGGAGEVAGSLAAGDEVSGKAVVEEMLGELGGGAAEVATGALRGRVQTPEQPKPADGLARLVAETEATAADASGAPGTGSIREDLAPVVVESALLKKPKLGKPAEAIVAAINARPDDHFKAELSQMEGADVDVVAQLARYGDETTTADEDFAKFAERMTAKFGDRVQAYLPFAWDAVSGGRPVRDLVPTSDPLQVENGWKRAAQWGRLFWEGAADVFHRSGLQSLAVAVDRHVDFSERNLAKAWAPIKPAIEPFQGIGGVARRGRAKLVFDEFEAFFRARENGRMEEAEKLLTTARPETRRLVAGVQQMFRYTGAENRRLGVRVRDRAGQLRPIGYLGADNFPRMMRDEVLAVLRDPSSNPQLWEQMRAELVKNGNIESRDDAAKFLQGAAPTETASDHFGSLEKARAARFPESWYEYSFGKVIPRYVAQWSERAAQIEAFGQTLAETDRDAFDVALAAVKNPELRRYIEATRDHAYRVNRLNPAARQAIGNATATTTALFLANPYSALRNLVGGLAQTTNQFGLARSLAAVRGTWQAIPDAEAAGALKADVADLIFHDDGAPEVRKGAGVALKLAGFNTAEQFVRAHSYLTAKTFLRDAVRSLESQPESRRSLQAVAFFRRHGVDPAKLVQEESSGPESERFLRGAVREGQGGYRYNQVPLFTDGPLGRFLLQFARWGTQATRFHAKHVIAPAVFGEDVPVRGADGKMTTRRIRTLAPLLRSPVVAMAAGTATFAAREMLFGIDRSDAGWDEVWRTLDENEQRGIELAFGHVLSDVIMGGTLGALTDYASMLRDAAERSRFKSPIEPPAASVIKEVGLLAYKQAQQGRLSGQDYREFAARLVTAYRYGSALAYRFGDAVGADWADARRFQAEQDRRFVRNVGRRFASEVGYDVPGVTGGLPRVTENSPGYDELEDALLSGEPGSVRRVISQRMAGARTDKERADRFRQMRTSALGRQPMKPGGQYGREDQEAFREWTRRRLAPEEVRRIDEVQRRYFATGERARLFTPADLERYATGGR